MKRIPQSLTILSGNPNTSTKIWEYLKTGCNEVFLTGNGPVNLVKLSIITSRKTLLQDKWKLPYMLFFVDVVRNSSLTIHSGLTFHFKIVDFLHFRLNTLHIIRKRFNTYKRTIYLSYITFVASRGRSVSSTSQHTTGPALALPPLVNY